MVPPPDDNSSSDHAALRDEQNEMEAFLVPLDANNHTTTDSLDTGRVRSRLVVVPKHWALVAVSWDDERKEFMSDTLQ